jgi:hypothetical protein
VRCEINDDWAVVRRDMTISREEPEEELKALKPTPRKHAAWLVNPDDAPYSTPLEPGKAGTAQLPRLR